MEPRMVFELWTLILLESFQPCCKDGLFAVVGRSNQQSPFPASPLPWGWDGADGAAVTAPTSSRGHLLSQIVCILHLLPGMHSSHRTAVMQDLMKTHTTPEKKWLKEKDELFKLPVYLFSPSRTITQMPSSDTNLYQVTKHQLSGAETRSKLVFSPNQIWYKH